MQQIQQISMSDIIHGATTGEKIRMLRALRGFTQEELANRSGVNQMSVYHWENGKRTPERRCLRDVAKALGIKEEDLM